MLDSEKRHRLFMTGWRYSGSKICPVHGCKSRVEFWRKGKQVAILDFIGMDLHWKTCTGITKGRLKKSQTSAQLEMFRREEMPTAREVQGH